MSEEQTIAQIHNFGLTMPNEKHTCYFYLNSPPKKVSGCSCMKFSWNNKVPLLKVEFSTPEEFPFQSEDEDGLMLSKLITITNNDESIQHKKITAFMVNSKKVRYGTS